MEFVEAMQKIKKICDAYERCVDCPLFNKEDSLCRFRCSTDYDFNKLNEIVSQWKPPVVDWANVAVDTPILVCYSEKNPKTKRHFARYENGKVYAWENGCTSWTTSAAFDWPHAELAEVENDER